MKLPTLLIPFILISFFHKTSAQFSFLNSQCGNTSYTTNSTYQTNLKTALNSLTSNTRATDGYYNFTAGHTPNKVEAIVLCRGDVPVNTCRLCIRDSAINLPLVCPNKKQALGYSDNCIIFFSDNSTFHVLRPRPHWALWNKKNASDIPNFNTTLTSLMGGLQIQASLGNSELKYATNKTNIIATNQTMYGLVQCTPDLSRLECVACVQDLFGFFPKWFVTPTFIAAGARIITPSCNLRYEIYSFYGNVTDVGSPPPPPPSPSPRSITPPPSNPEFSSRKVKRRSKSHRTTAIVTPIVGSILLIIAVASICITLMKKKRTKQTKKYNTNLDKEEIETLQSLQYSFEAIKFATNGFSDDNYLGEGGFGTVYKGTLTDGQEIAVKRLAGNSVQGNVQFKNEILLLAKLQHRNLVRLLGFCLEGEEMLLVYEFVTNSSLDKFLFDPLQASSLSWETRYKIIFGITRGLHYLHEDSRLRIIHRDLKAGNVLLDADFSPKIADFGTARLFKIDQSQAVASKIVGTYGYMAPEYLFHGQVSVKSDVFSFGVLVLEIISNQRICSYQVGENPENLLTFAWKKWQEGKAWDFVDPTLSSSNSFAILRCIHIGLLCVQHTMAERPTMSEVDLMLSNASVSLQVPSQPTFFTRGHTPTMEVYKGDNSDQSSNRLLECSVNDVSLTQISPR